MAANCQVMGPRCRFASSLWLNLFCAFVALAVATINGYFLVIFRSDNLPAGSGAL